MVGRAVPPGTGYPPERVVRVWRRGEGRPEIGAPQGLTRIALEDFATFGEDAVYDRKDTIGSIDLSGLPNSSLVTRHTETL